MAGAKKAGYEVDPDFPNMVVVDGTRYKRSMAEKLGLIERPKATGARTPAGEGDASGDQTPAPPQGRARGSRSSGRVAAAAGTGLITAGADSPVPAPAAPAGDGAPAGAADDEE